MTSILKNLVPSSKSSTAKSSTYERTSVINIKVDSNYQKFTHFGKQCGLQKKVEKKIKFVTKPSISMVYSCQFRLQVRPVRLDFKLCADLLHSLQFKFTLTIPSRSNHVSRMYPIEISWNRKLLL